MRRDDVAALKIVGVGVLGGLAVATGLLVLSLLIRADSLRLRVAMFLSLLAFTILGLVASARYRLGASRRNRSHVQQGRH